jgi:CheY-like chemotaxis protein
VPEWLAARLGHADAGPVIRVIVVDDHPMAREWTRAAIEDAEGMTVVGVAENGATGLHLIADSLPDVVVLDVHLPDISGVEVARRVRSALPDIGIVIVTGFDDPTYAKALLQLARTERAPTAHAARVRSTQYRDRCRARCLDDRGRVSHWPTAAAARRAFSS